MLGPLPVAGLLPFVYGLRIMKHLTDTDLAGERGCMLSDCGAYRYRLA
jgi:hypothetical protein